MKKQWKQLVGSGVFDSVSSRMKFWYQKLLIFHKLLYTVLQMWRNDEDDAFPKIYWVSSRNQTWATAGRSNQDLLTHCGSILRSRILVATHYTRGNQGWRTWRESVHAARGVSCEGSICQLPCQPPARGSILASSGCHGLDGSKSKRDCEGEALPQCSVEFPVGQYSCMWDSDWGGWAG